MLHTVAATSLTTACVHPIPCAAQEDALLAVRLEAEQQPEGDEEGEDEEEEGEEEEEEAEEEEEEEEEEGGEEAEAQAETELAEEEEEDEVDDEDEEAKEEDEEEEEEELRPPLVPLQPTDVALGAVLWGAPLARGTAPLVEARIYQLSAASAC